jgi:hypothetical protein
MAIVRGPPGRLVGPRTGTGVRTCGQCYNMEQGAEFEHLFAPHRPCVAYTLFLLRDASMETHGDLIGGTVLLLRSMLCWSSSGAGPGRVYCTQNVYCLFKSVPLRLRYLSSYHTGHPLQGPSSKCVPLHRQGHHCCPFYNFTSTDTGFEDTGSACWRRDPTSSNAVDALVALITSVKSSGSLRVCCTVARGGSTKAPSCQHGCSGRSRQSRSSSR